MNHSPHSRGPNVEWTYPGLRLSGQYIWKNLHIIKICLSNPVLPQITVWYLSVSQSQLVSSPVLELTAFFFRGWALNIRCNGWPAFSSHFSWKICISTSKITSMMARCSVGVLPQTQRLSVGRAEPLLPFTAHSKAHASQVRMWEGKKVCYWH